MSRPRRPAHRWRRDRTATPRPVDDPAEREFAAAQIRRCALSQLSPWGPKRLYDELALHAELTVERHLARSRLWVLDEPGRVRARRGDQAGLVHVLARPVTLPEATDDLFTGTVSSRWRDLLRPPAAHAAPEIARADLEVPGSLAELHDQFAANVVELDDGHVLATGDVVVPPLYGTSALVIHVPDGVAVRALAGCAGHNLYLATRRDPLAALAA